MQCPECHFDNADSMNFCGKCGKKLEKLCPQCNFENPGEYEFCGKCGYKLSISSETTTKELSFDEKLAKIQKYLPKGLTEKILSQRNRIEGERKQVTVMFCDMEGFTQLTEKLGPDDAYTTMDQIYEILIHKVHDFEGTVNEMTGDGIMALYGAPIALEDAPQRAIRSSLSIHREMVKFNDKLKQEKDNIPPLKMRIGVHTGPVVVGTLGNDLRVEFKAVGDTVNIASRMEGLAEPGTTYVTEETFKLTEGFFRFEALGDKEIKGKVLKYLDLANQKAIGINAIREAEDYFYEAMAHLDTLAEIEENRQRRISLLLRQVEAFMLLLKLPEYYDLLTRYEPMASGLGNPELLGAFYARLGHCEWAFGYFDLAIKTLTKAAELCEAAGNAEDAGYAYVWLEWSHLFRGDFDRVLAFKEDLLRTMQQRFNIRWYAYGTIAASRAYSYLGRWDEAVEEGQKTLSVAEEFSDNSKISLTANSLSMAYTCKGDMAKAVEYGELALQKAPTPANKMWAQMFLGWAWCRAGEPKRGIELLTATLPFFRDGRFMPSVIPTTGHLGEGYWLAGEDEKARHTLEGGMETAERCGARYYLGWAQRILGEISMEKNPTQAAAYFEKSITVLQEIKAENELALAYKGYGRLHKQKGQIAKAREYLIKALEIFDRLGTLIEPDKVREELDELPED